MSREYQVGGQFISESDTRQYQVGDIYINETVSVSPTGNRINIVICSGENDMQLLKQSTAATVLVGPVLDSTGAAYASAVIGDFNITKNGTTAAMASAATATHSHNGMYLILFTTGNTDTLGRLDISCNKATYAMGVRTFEVLTASTFDAIVTNAATAAGGLCDIQRMAGTALTGRDIGASVLLSSGTGTGQVKLSSGYIAPNWGDVGNPTTTLDLSATTIATTQKVDVETIKTNAVVNGGTITFPSGATLASTTNITAGTITTVTNLTNAPTSGDLTATMKSSVTTAATAATPVAASVSGDVDGTVIGTVSADVISIDGSTTAATNLGNTYAAFETGTATDGDAAEITLRVGASSTNDFYKDQAVLILQGTGAGQTNRIISYNGTSKVATVKTTWAVTPDNTSIYLVIGRIG